ncbi:MAG: YceI family protein [Acidimicrobiia bacterium]|nr:YceI family protein [Acidimicrobiia bacterium]
MSKRTKWILGAGIAGVIAVAAVLYFFVLGGADDPVSLEEAVGEVTQNTTPTESQPPNTATDPTQGATATTDAETADGAGLDGTWILATGLDSFVGYRVQEDLDPIGAATASGRTRAVTATLQIEGSDITDVFIDADVSQLESDRSNRDRALRSRGLESSTFPQATFQLTAPIELGSVPEDGQAVTVTAVGDLTAHGVTRSVTAAIDAQLTDGVIAVVGTIDLKLSDFDISGLTGFAVLSVEDEAQLEFQLLFTR